MIFFCILSFKINRFEPFLLDLSDLFKKILFICDKFSKFTPKLII